LRKSQADAERQLSAGLGNAKSLAAVSREIAARDKRLRALEEEMQNPKVLEYMKYIPVKHVPLCVAKFDVSLRHESLQATRAVHTILTRMVLFRCKWCNERFQTFHPGYRPPEHLKLELLRKAAGGVPVCSIEVAHWDRLPKKPSHETEEDLLVAKLYEGVCLGCQVDIDQQIKLGVCPIVPRRSHLNVMDPCWKFPHEELADLFSYATLVESMFVALEHMQVTLCQVRKTGLEKFKRNSISFPQDLAGFLARTGMLRVEEYRPHDRVNSRCGPGTDLERPVKTKGTAPADEWNRFGVAGTDNLVFPATVVSVEKDGFLVLEYDGYSGHRGIEKATNVRPRVQMPWSPRQVNEGLIIQLRRNIGHGDVLEGLEARWDLVAKIMQALIKLGPWRLDDSVGPMHQYYDPKLFDVFDEADMRRRYAPQEWQGDIVDAEEAEELRAKGYAVEGVDITQVGHMMDVGMNVTFVGAPGELGASPDEVMDRIPDDAFETWLGLSGPPLGSALGKWWAALPSSPEGDIEALKFRGDDTPLDFYAQIVADCRKQELLDGDVLTVDALVKWCLRRIGEDFASDLVADEEEMLDFMRMELRGVMDRFSMSDNTCAMERLPDCADADEEAQAAAQAAAGKTVMGWHSVSGDPTVPRAPGREAKAFPLDFPMGIGGLDDPRRWPVHAGEHTQHLLRLFGGGFVDSHRQHRVTWALVNQSLLAEASGKGHVVQRMLLRRMGMRLQGKDLMTRAGLQELIENEESARMVVHQLYKVGRDVRSTPMYWSYEGKKADCLVKHLSWRPPWVRTGSGEADDDYLGESVAVDDVVGLDRSPGFWGTLNCGFRGYNNVYDIHRLNIGAQCAEDAVRSVDSVYKPVRANFVRNAPDLVAFQIALRTELITKIVLPTVVPSSESRPFIPISRFETGSGTGNPHTHLLGVGDGNPVLDTDGSDEEEEQEAVDAKQQGADTAQQATDDGKKAMFESASDAAPQASRLPGGDPHRKRLRKSARRLDQQKQKSREERQKEQEDAVLAFFADKVSTWNPCFAEDGNERFRWDEEVGAHDIEATIMLSDTPERVRLRELLDRVFRERDAQKINLEPVRCLVAALVKASGRHTMHGKLRPTLGKHPCARGKAECPFCRYGFPQELVPQCGACIEHGDRAGEMRAKFPRNDALVCSFEPHILLANLGNVDWRPMLNLWAVLEYVTKYATKEPSGSRRVGDVLKDAVAEVCKFTPQGKENTLVWRTLQKFYARSLGERDYHLFEAVHLGLGLPLISSPLPVISLNTTGARAVKTQAQLANAGPDTPVVHDSKVDHFDGRLARMRRTHAKATAELRKLREREVRCLSLFEFVWKYQARAGGRLAETACRAAIMVTPSYPSHFASVGHERHAAFARSCVVAFWRHMPTLERYALMQKLPGMRREPHSDRRRWGTSVFVEPFVHAGSKPSEYDRYLGVQDLVMAFDGARDREYVWTREDHTSQPVAEIEGCSAAYGWTFALLEMMIDPLLRLWVPRWARKQYRVWNKTYRTNVLREILQEDHDLLLNNREVLERVHAKLLENEAAAKQKKAESAKPEGSPAEDGKAESDGGADPEGGDDDPFDEEQKAAVEDGTDALIREEQPDAGEDDACGGGDAAGDWANVSAAERVSGAGPAPAAAARLPPESGARFSVPGAGDINPPGHVWHEDNFVPRARVTALQRLWNKWRGGDVAYEGDVVRREDLDAWQGFAHDILERKAAQREEAETRSAKPGQELPPGSLAKYDPARLIVTGKAGTGKSQTIRACVHTRHERARRLKRPQPEVDGACVLAAPTGCASFQMKYGASTAHSAYGVGIAFLGPTKDKKGKGFCERARRLRNARLYVLDEFSMVGRTMLGKIEFRVQEALGASCRREFGRHVSMGGRDFVLAGDVRQATPVTGDPCYINGPYTGEAKNLPRRRKDGTNAPIPPGTPTIHDLVGMGLSFREEFEDVAILRQVHRVSRCRDDMTPEQRVAYDAWSPEQRVQYEADADRFLEIVERMSNLAWTEEDHRWLSQFNRRTRAATEKGKKELEKFDNAPRLVDTRKMTASGGEDLGNPDGADVLNFKQLQRVAKQLGVPIARIGGYHDLKKSDPDLKAELLSEDAFRGLVDMLHLCIGARVLLTHNLWVPAGLMNGALGTVRGFVWPENGDPASDDSTKRAPLCVVVEFDDVVLGKEQKLNERGEPEFDAATNEPVMVPRNFFPDLENGEKCVPIFRADATSEDGVGRHQFPLTLAWALTHWKAQGMTLPRVRISMGDRIASTVGVGYVAITRVKHPWDLVFDTDLPAYEVFMKAQRKPVFCQRQRFLLRMEAKASRTLRRYRFCSRDPWSADDAAIAEKLLLRLEARAARERSDQGMDGDMDAWPWGEREPPIAEAMAAAVRDFAGGDPLLLERAMRVAERMQAPTRLDDGSDVYLHMPAIKEALGCLIPRDLHPRLDGKTLKGKLAPSAPAGGVYLQAGRWNVSVADERDLHENRALKRGFVEFFLTVASRVAQGLNLPVAVASHKVGELVAAAEDVEELRATLADLVPWRICSEQIESSDTLLLPVCGGDGREWLLARVSAAKCEEICVDEREEVFGELARASKLAVEVFDRLVRAGGRSTRGGRLARNVDAVLRGLRRFGGDEKVDVGQGDFPKCDSSLDSAPTVLGLIFARLCALAGEDFPAPDSSDFVEHARKGLRLAFSYLRAGAGRTGDPNVLLELKSSVKCRELLRLFSGTGVGAPVCAMAPAPSTGAGENIREVAASDKQFLRVLTWNINGDAVSASAPESWSPADKKLALRRELARWDAHVIALQECSAASRCDMVGSDYDFLGSVSSHCGFGHLYVRRGLAAKCQPSSGRVPCVRAVMHIGEISLGVIATHLVAGADETAAADRLSQLKEMVETLLPEVHGVLLLGDMNMREEEAVAFRECSEMLEALYGGKSWDPVRNRFFKEHQDKPPPAEKFDRVFYFGAVFAQSFLVGQCRDFVDGRGFCISDHYGVLSVVDVHKDYDPEAGARAAGERRLAVTRLRDLEWDREQSFVVEEERERLRCDRRRQAEMQQREMEDAYAEAKRAAKAVRDRRLTLRKNAFGRGTLFERAVSHQFLPVPVAPAEMAIEAYAGLSGVGGSDAWVKVVNGKFPPLAGFGGGAGGTYAEAVAHALLRVPAVAIWLDGHVKCCRDAREQNAATGQVVGDCLACALRRSRRSMGRMGERAALLASAGVAGRRYADTGHEHDVSSFLVDMLKAMRLGESSGLRSVTYHGAPFDGQPLVTHVERLFGFLADVRSKCSKCGVSRNDFEGAYLLDLAAAGSAGEGPGPSCITDLYLRACAPRDVQRECGSRACGGAIASHSEQRCLATLPNVLLVKVSGTVHAEEQISFPDLGHMVLSAVIYRGRSRGGGIRYLCASRGPDGLFWMFDGSRYPWRPGQEIGHVLPAGVVLLVYMRPGGKACFAGSAVFAPIVGAGRRRRLLRKTTSAEEQMQVGLENRPSGETGGTPPRVRRLLAGPDDATPCQVSGSSAGVDRPGALVRHDCDGPATPTRRLRRKTPDAQLTGVPADVGAASEEEPQRPLAELFERYPQLRLDPVAISSLDAWRDDPESARCYAENAARAGWPGVKLTASSVRAAGPSLPDSAIGKALNAGSVGSSGSGGSPLRRRTGIESGASPVLCDATTPERQRKAARLAAELAGLDPQEMVVDPPPCADTKEANAKSGLQGRGGRRSTASGKVAVAAKHAADAKAAAAAEAVAAAKAASRSAGAGVAPDTDRVYGSREVPASRGAVPAWRLRCFQSLGCSLEPSSCDVRGAQLLQVPQVDVCGRVYGLSKSGLLETLWRCSERPTGGVNNLGNSCFISAVLQVLARVEPFVKLVASHRCQEERDCFLCKVHREMDLLRAGELVTESSVTLATRAGDCKLEECDFAATDALGMPVQCDAWLFCRAVVHELWVAEKRQKRLCLRSESEAALADVQKRPVLEEHVRGSLCRTRVRCAQCRSTSDSLLVRESIDLNLAVGLRSLQALYEYHVGETRGAHTRCPAFEAGRSGCAGKAYSQDFLEREPPVLFFCLLRFGVRRSRRYTERGQQIWEEFRMHDAIDFPQEVGFLRSGPYHFAAAVLHHGASTKSGHYTALCWEGQWAGEDRYRWYNDDAVSGSMTWREVWRTNFGGASIGSAAYFLVYVRTKFWGDAVGDGSESTPYKRDAEAVAVAKSRFRGEAVPALVSAARGDGRPVCNGGGVASGSVASSSAGDSRAAGASEEQGDARWKRFTPEHVNADLCQARTWAAGKGGQCGCKPVQGEQLCASHLRQLREGGLAHGWVSGCVPEKALSKFEHERRKAACAVARSSAGSSSDVLEPHKRQAASDGTPLGEEGERAVGKARRQAKSQAADYMEVEADAESGGASAESDEDVDRAAEMVGFLTDADLLRGQQKTGHAAEQARRERAAPAAGSLPEAGGHTLRRSSRVASREAAASSTVMPAAPSRVVTFYGDSENLHLENLDGHIEEVERGASRRAADRRDEFTRGRHTGMDGQDLDRSVGKAWSAGRR